MHFLYFLMNINDLMHGWWRRNNSESDPSACGGNFGEPSASVVEDDNLAQYYILQTRNVSAVASKLLICRHSLVRCFFFPPPFIFFSVADLFLKWRGSSGPPRMRSANWNRSACQRWPAANQSSLLRLLCHFIIFPYFRKGETISKTLKGNYRSRDSCGHL